MHLPGVLLLLALSASCGKSGSNAGIPLELGALPVNGSNSEGLFMAEFITLNSHINGTLPGSATLQRKQDKLFAYVRLSGGAPHVWHQQNIHEGGRCPTMKNDLNGDGFIDIEEGNKVWGKILVPLDADLSGKLAGKNIYPLADESGGYYYERVTNFEEMMKDLKHELRPEEGLSFEGKVVVVHGTADTVSYPDTVNSSNGRPPYQTLPVACGTFAKVTKIPGEILTEEVPGPVGEPEEIATPEDPVVIEHHPPASRSEEDDNDNWFDEIGDWWRSIWERGRGGRRQRWGNGRWEDR